MKQTLFTLILLLPFCLKAQIPNRVNGAFPLMKGGEAIHAGWCGGLNSPQFSQGDLDGDGKEDLFAFDKAGNNVITYLNTGSTTGNPFVYAPQFEKNFPKELDGWAQLHDFNKDGIPDLFALNGNSIACYQGYRTNGTLHFKMLNPVIKCYFNNAYWDHIWSFIDDYEGIVDVNGDGDMDILTFAMFGGSTVEYYENQSVEDGHGLDSMNHFLQLDPCWGKFVENSNSHNVLLHAPCKGGMVQQPGATNGRHQGGTLFTFDYDNDHDVDILDGDVSYSSLIFLRNGGDSSYADMDYMDTLFPVYDVPADMPIFPGAFGVDANNDGFKDLFIAPFADYYGNLGLIKDVNNVLFYKNQGLTTLNKFTYQSPDYFTKDIFDAGSQSKPAFFDYNGDGLLDIIVGNSLRWNGNNPAVASLSYLKNVGTLQNPKFDLVSSDLDSTSKYALLGFAPAFAQLDNDSLEDMILGDDNGRLNFFKNTGGINKFPTLSAIYNWRIDVGRNAMPCFFDVNGDGLKDMIVGRTDGKLSYFWNIGTAAYASFSPDSVNAFFGNITVADTAWSAMMGSSAPFVQIENGKKILYVGAETGNVFKFEILADSLKSGSFPVLSRDFLGEKIGFKTTPAFADINHDGKVDYLFGNARGGLVFYSDTTLEVLSVNTLENEKKNLNLKLYPNPANNQLTLEFPVEKGNKVSIYNSLGQLVNQFEMQHAVETIPIQQLEMGLYVVSLTVGENKYTSRFAKVK